MCVCVITYVFKYVSLNYNFTALMNDWLFIPIYTMKAVTLKRNAYNEIYSDNSLNVCIYLTTYNIDDRKVLLLLSRLIRW